MSDRGWLLPARLDLRVPESGRLQGWVAQAALMLGLDRYGVADPCSYLLADGAVETEEGPQAFIEAALAHAEAHRQPLDIAHPTQMATPDWLRGLGPLGRRLAEAEARGALRLGSAEQLAVRQLRELRRGEGDRYRQGRLLVLEGRDVLLDRARREVRLFDEVPRPDLARRVEEAFRVARGLRAEVDEAGALQLDPAAVAAAIAAERALPTWWRGRKRAQRLLTMVVAARTLLREGEHYVLEDRQIQLDAERLPEGLPQRVGDVGLEMVLRRVLGLPPGMVRVPVAGCELQTMVRRYRHLSVLLRPGSGAVRELRRIYGIGVLRATSGPALRLAGPLLTGPDDALQLPVGGWVIERSELMRGDGQGEDGPLAALADVPGAEVLELAGRSFLVRRGDGPMYWLGGPTPSDRRRATRRLLERALDRRLGDLLWWEHPLVATVVENSSPRSASFLRRAPALLQSLWLAARVRGLERQTEASRIALYRANHLQRHRFAFLGGGRT